MKLSETVCVAESCLISETIKLQRVVRENIMRVFDEQEVLNMDLENKHKRLDSWSKELKNWEALIDRERQKLEEETNKASCFDTAYESI